MKNLVTYFFILLISSLYLVSQDPINGTKALDMLKQGNIRFSSSKSIHPDISLERLKETAENSQHPFATVLSCSDSRVPVEILFDQGVGDIFTVKVAGNVMDTDEIGSIEYGIGHLKTQLLVILGHTKCGAVTAICTNAEVHGSIPELVDNIIPAVNKSKAENPGIIGKDLVPSATIENVFQSIEDLLKRSEETRKLIEEGQLIIVGAIYDISTGTIKWLGPHPKQVEIIKTPLIENSHSKTTESKHEISTDAKVKDTIDNPNVNLEFGFFLAITFLVISIPVTLISMLLFDWIRKRFL